MRKEDERKEIETPPQHQALAAKVGIPPGAPENRDPAVTVSASVTIEAAEFFREMSTDEPPAETSPGEGEEVGVGGGRADEG